MFEHLTQFLELHILPLGAWGVFLASVAEEVVAPIPSALVMMTAGFLLVTGPVSVSSILKLVLYVGLPAAAGVTLGSLWIYGVAYWGGRPFLERFGKWIGLYWSDVETMKAKFENSRGDEVGIVSARILPVVPSVAISAFCGFIRMSMWKYILLTFTGMFLRAILMGTIGWQVGNVYERYAATISQYEDVGLKVIIALFVVGAAALFYRKKIGYSGKNGEQV